MLNLIGVHGCKMDAKGRLMVPSALKKQLLPVLEKGFVIKRSVFSKCLEIYPMSEWEVVMKKVNRLNRFKKKNNDFIRMFTAGVRMIEVDGTGRLNIPKDLMDFAGLTKEIVLASAVNIIEVWDEGAYEKAVNDPDLDFGALAEEVMGDEKEDEDGLS